MTTDSVVSTSFREVYSAALRGEACHIVGPTADPRPLPVAVWNQSTDAGDAAVLDQCVGTTLDIGCGPGRMTEQLARRGHRATGVDVVPEAVLQTLNRGVVAILRDVFDPLPDEGRWETALLADGNIGIGGDPAALLRRVRALVVPGGRIVVDLHPPGSGVQTHTMWLETRSGRSRPFLWSLVGADSLAGVAAGTGCVVETLLRHQDRWFSVLRTETR